MCFVYSNTNSRNLRIVSLNGRSKPFVPDLKPVLRRCVKSFLFVSIISVVWKRWYFWYLFICQLSLQYKNIDVISYFYIIILYCVLLSCNTSDQNYVTNEGHFLLPMVVGYLTKLEQAQSEQIIKNLQRENAMIATAWYDLTSRLQSNHVVLQRRHDVPKSWLNKQRQMVNGKQTAHFPHLT